MAYDPPLLIESFDAVFKPLNSSAGLANVPNTPKIDHDDPGARAFWRGWLIGNIWSININRAGSALRQFNMLFVLPRVTQP